MILAAAVVGGALSAPLLLSLIYVGGDLARSDMGYLCELQHQLGTGAFWLAPHLGAGQPMFADPQFQLLYPPRWIGALFPPDVGASLSAVLQLALGAAGAAWLLRSYGVRTFGASCLAIAYAFSGTALNLTWHAAYMAGAAWLPFARAAGRRLLQGASHPLIAAAFVASLALLTESWPHTARPPPSRCDDPLGQLGEGPLPEANDVTVEPLGPNKLRLTLSGSGGAVAGVRTSFQAGWHASQAGRELPVVRAAGAHLAVVVDRLAQGPIELEYRPPRMAAGLIAAPVGIVLAALGIFGRLGRSRMMTSPAGRDPVDP